MRSAPWLAMVLVLGCAGAGVSYRPPSHGQRCEAGVCVEIASRIFDESASFRMSAPPGTLLLNATFLDGEAAAPCSAGLPVTSVAVESVLYRSGPVDIGGEHEMRLVFAGASQVSWLPADRWRAVAFDLGGAPGRLCRVVVFTGAGDTWRSLLAP